MPYLKFCKVIFAIVLSYGTLTACGEDGPVVGAGHDAGGDGQSNDFCRTGKYPTQWIWAPNRMQQQPASAVSGTPRIDHIRNGKVIATYTSLGGDAGYSKPNSVSFPDKAVGPFRRQPYTQWKSGDIFEIYPAVYSGANMQIYIGPNAENDPAFKAKAYDIPSNLTIRGLTINGRRPVIINPPTGASSSNYGQSLIYIEGLEDKNSKSIRHSFNVTLENLDIVDSPSGGNIGKAAVYINGASNLTFRNMRIAGFKQHGANGVFATSNNVGVLLLENVELDSNGGASGPEHNAYINASNSDPNFTFIVRGSWSHDAYYGHAIKSRAQRTMIEGSYLSGQYARSGTQGEAYLLDVPNGGILIARNNIFAKNHSGNQSNGASITFGIESADAKQNWGLVIEHNTFVAFSKYYDDAQHPLYPLFVSKNAPGPKRVDSNVFIGYCPTMDATKDYRGFNFATLNFNDIDQSFRPRKPDLNGNPAIIGSYGYEHKAKGAQRATAAKGAQD